jgi:hypothetical protein
MVDDPIVRALIERVRSVRRYRLVVTPNKVGFELGADGRWVLWDDVAHVLGLDVKSEMETITRSRQ